MRPGESQNRDVSKDERLAVDKALRAVGSVRTILDVGAGNGRWLPVLAEKKASLVVALDMSRETLAQAREVAGPQASPDRAALVSGDVGALPFPSQSFDLVICLELMAYVRRTGRLRALREMRRVSSRWVIVQYAHNEGMSFAWQRFRSRLGLEANYPRNHLSMEEVEFEFRRVGLGIRGVASVGGSFSRSWVILAEAPSPEWMKD